MTYPVVESLSYIHALKAVDMMWEWSRTHISDGGIEVDININWCPIGLATLKSKGEEEIAIGSEIAWLVDGRSIEEALSMIKKTQAYAMKYLSPVACRLSTASSQKPVNEGRRRAGVSSESCMYDTCL